jgi:hypothetical protein
MAPLTWFKIANLEQPLEESVDLPALVAHKLQLPVQAIQEVKILRKSLDARSKNRLKFIYNVAFGLAESAPHTFRANLIPYLPPDPPPILPFLEFDAQPVIIGTGPAGLFAALALVTKGYRPLVFERGNNIAQRIRDVRELWRKGILNENSNVQFGEGGAGTFSDGKLTARTQDYFTRQVLQELIKFGAPAEIFYEHRPHIGTDRLRAIVLRIRKYLLQQGAQIFFNTPLTAIHVQNQAVSAVTVNGTRVPTRTLLLAPGHSARELYQLLLALGVELAPKAFAVGVRVEHPCEFIDHAQYGQQANLQLTGAADYKLTYNWLAGGRGVYSFCMCPGGEIILSTHTAQTIVTNGMSRYARNHPFSNAGLVVTVNPVDFPAGPLGGIAFQEMIEQRAFLAGGENYCAPAQRIPDFMQEKVSLHLKPGSYQPGITAAPMHQLLPTFITDALKAGLVIFDRQIPGFIKEGVMVAPETRTSAPVRMVRHLETGESTSLRGLFPLGEGAGYAGGIVSSAADALKLIWRVKPLN